MKHGEVIATLWRWAERQNGNDMGAQIADIISTLAEAINSHKLLLPASSKIALNSLDDLASYLELDSTIISKQPFFMPQPANQWII